jgi:hypothetical protein
MGCCERVTWATSSLMIAVSGGDVPLRRGGGVTVAELRLPTGYHRIAASEFRCCPHNDLSTPTHQIPVRCDLMRACPPNGVAQPSPVHQTTRPLTYENQYARPMTSLSGPYLVRETIRNGTNWHETMRARNLWCVWPSGQKGEYHWIARTVS